MNVFRKKNRVGLKGLSICLSVCLCLSVSAVCLGVAHWISINDTEKSLGQSVRSGSIFAVVTHRSCPNALVTFSITAPAHLHATVVACISWVCQYAKGFLIRLLTSRSLIFCQISSFLLSSKKDWQKYIYFQHLHLVLLKIDT